MELRLDSAIDKADDLERDLEVNRMMKTFDSLKEKVPHEQVDSIVAEPNSHYRTDIF